MRMNNFFQTNWRYPACKGRHFDKGLDCTLKQEIHWQIGNNICDSCSNTDAHAKTHMIDQKHFGYTSTQNMKHN
jgi:hypothetical protein